ncbi:MAG TPA: 1-acyl-sn-glycerol-3-phosphate acyltransferase [bacterium]|nr:1-acyl-sn-glycerol-3-phosphate acyltransferase [bacterium]
MRHPPSITEFRPAKPSRFFIRLMRLVNRFCAMPRARVSCEIRDTTRLRHLPPGVLLTPNHSDFADAIVVTELLRRTDRFATFMASRENFDVHHGLNGLVMQWMGGFSVNRGGENAKCQQFAREVVKQGRYDLLVFPEGEVYLLNDLVMPFKPGVAMLALDAASENRREGRSERPVMIVPVAIKYRYMGDVTPALDRLAADLETTYFGEGRTGPLYDRIYAIGVELLSRKEEEWGLRPDPAWNVYQRVHHIQKFLLESLERRYLGRVRDEFPFDRARRLMLHLLEKLDVLRVQPDLSDEERKARSADLRRDLQRAEAAARSVSFADDYVLNRPTPERIAETLTKLEREIRGRYVELPKVRRSAAVTVGEPIDVRGYLAAYDARGTRKETILRLTRDLQTGIQIMIDAANAAGDTGGRA